MINGYIIKNNLDSGKVVFDTHLHDTFEINFMLSENVEVITDNKLFLSHKGDVFIFPPFTFHKIDSKNAPFSRYLMFFEERAAISACPALKPAAAALKKASPPVVHLNDTQTRELLNLFGEAEIKLKENGFLEDFENICALGRILSYIARNIDEDNTADICAESEHELLKILEYVNNNISENLNVGKIAEDFNMSSTTLWHMMKKNLGMSLKEYILKIRIAKAMELLSSGMSVNEVSDRTGFNSYPHFIRTFTKTVGTPPYRYGRGR